MDPLDFNCFDGFLNCSIDFMYIFNHLIPWEIDYKEAYTTRIAKVQSKHLSDFYRLLQWLLSAWNEIIYM